MAKRLGAVSVAGQTTTEFATVAVTMMLLAMVMLILLSAFNEYGQRILSLVGLDYP